MVDFSEDFSENKKLFTFVYKSTAQDLVVYKGTLQNDIIATLYILLKIDTKKTLYFLDEQGIPIVLSSMIPNRTKIFVKDEDSLISSIPLAIQFDLKPWVWDQPNSVVAFIDEKTFKTFDENLSSVYGKIKFSQGKHYWSIQISHIFCCHDMGITKEKVPEGEYADYQESPHRVGLPGLFPKKNNGPRSTGCSNLNMKDHVIGFFLDMDEKHFFIFNETEKVLYAKKAISFDSCVPFYVSRKHAIVVSLLSSGTEAPKWMVDEIKQIKF